MQTRGRRLKFTAVSVMVVLALTGFSSGRHGSHSRHGGGSGGGGGCSSSSQDHDSSSSSTSGGSGPYGGSDSYDDSDSASSSGSSGSSGGTYQRRPTHRSTPTSSSSGGSDQPLDDATATLVSCADKKAPYATVEVKNPNARKGTFKVGVTFMDSDDIKVTDDYADVTVGARGKATVRVKVGGTGLIDSGDHCDVDPVASVR